MALAFTLYADVSATLLDDGAADGEAETGALYEVVELDEAFEDAGLLFQRNTCTRVFTIEEDAAVLLTIAHADMSLVGIFDGIGDEVGKQLLQSATVEYGGIGGVGIILQERDASLLYALLERQADVVEGACKVYLLGFDGQRLSDG